MLLIMGVLVGVIVSSLILPIFKLSRAVSWETLGRRRPRAHPPERDGVLSRRSF
jgi:hypothetical protein